MERILKYHKFFSVISGLGFLVVLQMLSYPQPIFRFLVPGFLLFSFAVSLYNRWYLKHIQKYNFWVVVRMWLLFAGAFGIFVLIPSEFLRGGFLVITVVVVAVFEYFLANFAENVFVNQTILAGFALFYTLAALTQFFPQFRFMFIFGAFLTGALLARAFYEFIPQSDTAKTVAALALGLFAAELLLALTFLPFHFSVLTVILFNVFYFCLILNYYYLFQTLNLKKMQFHLALIVITSGLTLLATPWQILA